MKKGSIPYIEGDYICFQMSLSVAQLYLENIFNSEILTYLLHFSEVLKRILIIKYFVG